MKEMTTSLVVVKMSYFGDNYTAGSMVHTITKGVVVATGNRSTKTQKSLINTSMVAIKVFIMVKRQKMPNNVG